MANDFDPYVEQYNAERGAQVIQVTTVNVPLLVLMCVLTGMSIMGSLWAIERAQAAQEQARRSELRVEGFTRALIAHDIDPYPHVAGEDP